MSQHSNILCSSSKRPVSGLSAHLWEVLTSTIFHRGWGSWVRAGLSFSEWLVSELSEGMRMA
jgi:hypothetical protein